MNAAYGAALGFAVFYALFATLPVVYIQPIAGGSGLIEVIGKFEVQKAGGNKIGF